MKLTIKSILWVLLTCLSVISGSLQAKTTTTIYYHNDALGSPVVATHESGAVIWRKVYAPFGQKIGTDERAGADHIGYSGKPDEGITGLTYLNARYYDPVIGRFMAVDKVDPITGGVEHFNRYSYAYNNPYRYTDPTGDVPLETLSDIGFVLYDVGKIGVGFFTDNPLLMQEGVVDFLGDGAALLTPYLPAGGTRVARAIGNGVEDVAKKVDLKQTGSYTNTHASGKTYAGKGSRQRSQKSGRREARRNEDPHVATDWTSAQNNRDAFKQESHRLDAEGGASSSSNYNRIEQPGKKYRQQDGEL